MKIKKALEIENKIEKIQELRGILEDAIANALLELASMGDNNDMQIDSHKISAYNELSKAYYKLNSIYSHIYKAKQNMLVFRVYAKDEK